MIILSPDAIEDVARLRSFLNEINPDAARRAMATILTATERLQEFPELGVPTADAAIRQIVIRFGASGYIVRYALIAETQDILVTRIWHGPRGARLGIIPSALRGAGADPKMLIERVAPPPESSCDPIETGHDHQGILICLRSDAPITSMPLVPRACEMSSQT